MAQGESNIVADCLKRGSKLGCVLAKNVRGGMYPIQSIRPLIAAIMRRDWAACIMLVKGIHPIQAGWMIPGSGDLLGWKSVVITPEMIGRKIAIFMMVEVKTATGTVKPEQKHCIKVVSEAGGITGVARSAEDLEKIIQNYFDTK